MYSMMIFILVYIVWSSQDFFLKENLKTFTVCKIVAHFFLGTFGSSCSFHMRTLTIISKLKVQCSRSVLHFVRFIQYF